MISKTKDYYAIQVVSYVLVGVVGLLCLLPFVMIISGSFSDEEAILKNGFSLLPQLPTLDAYRMVFRSPKIILDAYAVSIFVTAAGTILSMFITLMTGYVLSRPDFKYRNKFAFFFYFSSIFSGGMIPSYILITQYMNMKDNLLAIILPPLLSAWNIFLMRNFLSSVPFSLAESAKIDGANDLTIFFRIYAPLSTSGMVTVGLFTALYYWNDWSSAMLYIDKQNLYPLQYLLQRMLASVKALQDASNRATGIIYLVLPTENLKMAMAVVATGPIILLYPFTQRYFVKGLVMGAVKG
jgi:putative aldouronate transport system permease protein